MNLFQDNCDFFQDYLSYGESLVQTLNSVPDDCWEFSDKESVDRINLWREGKEIYLDGALEFAKLEVTHYLENPSRHFSMKPIVEIEEGKTASRFRKELYEQVGDWNYYEEPTSDAGYAVIFGLGIGLHLNFLVQYLPVDHFIFCESDLVQFRASCDVFSWRQFISTLEKAGKKVSFLVTGMTNHLGNAAMNMMRDEFHVNLDGSYFYQHGVDMDGSLIQTRKTFEESLSTLEYSMGFFEDECLMFKNTMANLARHDFYLMPKAPKTKIDIPAMIIGSGPSVDEAIEAVKQNEKNAILFSGGTSYSILKRNGMTSDFHTLYENDSLNYDVMKDFADTYSFEDTYLIAPMTIDPRIPPFFKHVIFYFRDSLSPTLLLAEDEQIVSASGPTVSNVACRAAFSLGAESLALFGVDLGGTSEEDHHSKDTIYHLNKGRIGEDSGRQFDELERQLIPVQGTYHKTVYTNRLLMQARMFFESMFFDFKHVPVVNCSNGAKIQGVHDILPSDFKVNEIVLEKKDKCEKVLDDWDYFNAGAYVKKSHLDEFETKLNTVLDGIESLCKEADKDVSIQEFLSKVIPIALIGQVNSIAATSENSAKTLVLGTIQQLMQTGHYLYRRTQEEDSERFMEIFRDLLLPYIQEMRDVSSVLLSDARSELITSN